MYTRAYVYIDHVIFATFWLFQENSEKIKVFKVLPYLVSNVVEVRGTAEVLYVHVCVCDSELVKSVKGANPSLAVTCTPLHVCTGRLCVVLYCSLIPIPCCYMYTFASVVLITFFPSCWTSPPATRPRRKEGTWTWMLRGRARQQSSRPPPDRQGWDPTHNNCPEGPLSVHVTIGALSFGPESVHTFRIRLIQMCVCVLFLPSCLVDVFPASDRIGGPFQALSWRPRGG